MPSPGISSGSPRSSCRILPGCSADSRVGARRPGIARARAGWMPRSAGRRGSASRAAHSESRPKSVRNHGAPAAKNSSSGRSGSASRSASRSAERGVQPPLQPRVAADAAGPSHPGGRGTPRTTSDGSCKLDRPRHARRTRRARRAACQSRLTPSSSAAIAAPGAETVNDRSPDSTRRRVRRRRRRSRPTRAPSPAPALTSCSGRELGHEAHAGGRWSIGVGDVRGDRQRVARPRRRRPRGRGGCAPSDRGSRRRPRAAARRRRRARRRAARPRSTPGRSRRRT